MVKTGLAMGEASSRPEDEDYGRPDGIESEVGDCRLTAHEGTTRGPEIPNTMRTNRLEITA
jgi:hypothetical protein